MHIAILFYGRINKFKEHYDNILHSIGQENTFDIYFSSDNSLIESLNEFIDLYKPIAYNNNEIYYDCDITKYPNRPLETSDETLDKLIRHYINKNRVFKLLEQHIQKENIHYDVVASLRLDLVFHNKFNFDNIEDNTIYIPSGKDWYERSINDQVAYGNFDVMKKYMHIYENIIYLLDSGRSVAHSESLHYANIEFYNLKVIRVDLSYYIGR